MQAVAAFVKGMRSLEQAIESQLYEPNLLTFHDVDGIWSRYMPLPPCSLGAPRVAPFAFISLSARACAQALHVKA